MASLEDYDEFGNYIGADLDSDDGADVPDYEIPGPSAPQPTGGAAPLEGFEDEDAREQNALMEVDGA